MRKYHIGAGIVLIALALFLPASWPIKLILIVGGVVNLGVSAMWDDRL